MAGGKSTEAKFASGLPTIEDLESCAKLTLFGEDGDEHTFESIVDGDGTKSRHMIIFIRHFFCGMCQAYVSALSNELGPVALPSDTSITIVGCGYPDLIANYSAVTKCCYPLYTDPTGAIYDALHMASTLELGPRAPHYNKQSVLTTSLRSVLQVVTWKGGRQVNRAGSWTQVGGEFLFERKRKPSSTLGSWDVTFCHRMRNTRDHMEVDQMKRLVCDGELGNEESRVTGNVDVKIKDFACKNGACDRRDGDSRPKRRSTDLLESFRRSSSNRSGII